MTSIADLAEAHPVIGRRWSHDQSAEQARILGLARDALDFIFSTGQRYAFKDFFTGSDSLRSPPRGGHSELRERMDRTRRFFEKVRDEPELAEEVAQSQAILDAIRYIDSTGQHDAFADFLEHVEAHALPFAVASFDKREDAETWLKSHPNPPDSADVLIANEYHVVIHIRDTNMRLLPYSRALEWYLEEIEQKERPVAAASFETREEADAWLKAQAKPARRTWVQVGGELYIAAYYPNIHHRALFPLSRAHGPEKAP